MIDTLCVTLLIIAVIAVGGWIKINKIRKETEAYNRQMEEQHKKVLKNSRRGEVE